MNGRWPAPASRGLRPPPLLRPADLLVAGCATALVGAGALLVLAPGDAICGALLAGLVALVATIDARRYVIPDGLSLAVAALGLIWRASGAQMPVVELAASVLRAAVFAGVFWAIRLVYARLRRREGLGLGDVKFAAATGPWISFESFPIMVLLAAVAVLLAMPLQAWQRGRPLSARMRLPLGSFLSLATWLVWFVAEAGPVSWL